MAAAEISVIGRNTQGVRIMSMEKDDTLAAVVRVPKEEGAEADTAAAEALQAGVEPPAETDEDQASRELPLAPDEKLPLEGSEDDVSEPGEPDIEGDEPEADEESS